MRGKTSGKEQKRIRARSVVVPVLTVARPRNQCCARGRRDVQVGVRPRRMSPFPQPAFASPFFPRAPLSPGLRGELCVTGRGAPQAWPGPGAQPEGRGPLSAGGSGFRELLAVPLGCGGRASESGRTQSLCFRR